MLRRYVHLPVLFVCKRITSAEYSMFVKWCHVWYNDVLNAHAPSKDKTGEQKYSFYGESRADISIP
jgi:hypothetical protein